MKFTAKEKIIALLYRKGWTQAALARKVHVSTSTLSRILHGSSRKIQDYEFIAFAKAFAIPMDDLRDDK